MLRLILGAICATILSTTLIAHAQNTAQIAEENKDVQNLDLEDLLNIKTTVATKKALSATEAPSIVTAITSEEIRNSGARDLADVLTTFVPGFQIAPDIEVAMGPALRGIWAIEGKILLLIDGVEANDDVWGNMLFGNHYPADMIDHVEVVRGPGSAIYGGYASLGVISVTTKGAIQNTAGIHFLNSQMAKAPSHRDLVIGYSKTHKNNLSSSVYLTTGTGSRTDSKYSNFFYTPQNTYSDYNVADKMTADPKMLNANLKYKGLDFRAIIDLFKQGYPLQAVPEVNSPDMEYSYLYDLKYEYKVSDKLKITPRISYSIHKPFNIEAQGLDTNQTTCPGCAGYDVSENHRDSKTNFYGVSALWDPNKDLSIISGAEHYKTVIYVGDGWFTKTNSQNGGPVQTFNTFSGSSYGNENTAVYTQGTLQHPIANFTFGARYEKTWRFGDAFVPRVGITKSVDKFHSKFMLTQSFRTPRGIQIDKAVGELKPEKALNTELEVGYRISPEMLVQGNVYDIQIQNLLLYTPYTAVASSAYQTVGGQRTQGVEAEFRYLSKRKSLTANYAFYKNISHPGADDVAQNQSANIGLPQNRLNITGGYKVSESLSIHPTAQYFGKNYSWNWTDGTTNPIASVPTTPIELDPVWYFHLNVRVRDILTKGLDLEFGGHNIFNQTGFLPQAYAGYINPQPVDSRSWMVRLGYTKEI